MYEWKNHFGVVIQAIAAARDLQKWFISPVNVISQAEIKPYESLIRIERLVL